MAKTASLAWALFAVVTLACGGDKAAAPFTVATPGLSVIPNDNRLRIARLGIDAPLALGPASVSKGLPSPQGADDVVLYDFALSDSSLGGLPGEGNAILVGRRDAKTPCQGGTV